MKAKMEKKKAVSLTVVASASGRSRSVGIHYFGRKLFLDKETGLASRSISQGVLNCVCGGEIQGKEAQRVPVWWGQ